MQRTVLVRLAPTDEQSASLRRTMRAFNAACGHAAGLALTHRPKNRIALHHLAYKDLRDKFGISAQMAVRVVTKAFDAWRNDKETLPKFRPLGGMPYDQRILSWKKDGSVSILTLDGRVAIRPVLGDFQRQRFASGVKHGQAKLLARGAKTLLAVTVEEAEPPVVEPNGWLGVDLGIRNIATDSDGGNHTSFAIEAARIRVGNIRSTLQSVGTKSAKRHLRRLSGKESRFRKDINHCISKTLVASAKGTGRGLALEDLKGIRSRTTVRRKDRSRHSSWAFWQLRSFVEYKARLAGVAVELVDPKNTSRTCPECQSVDKRNRPSRDEFRCVGCGREGAADHVAAINIAARAGVVRPNVSGRGPLHNGSFRGASPGL